MTSTTPTPPGRPRAFDIDEALDRAVLVFWSKGFEGASLDDLTEAMGISRPSLYRAFGNKEDLFYKALERYTEGLTAYFAQALTEPTSRAVATAVLHGTVEAATVPGLPAGCLGVLGALATGDESRPVRDALIAWREEGIAHLTRRFQQAMDAGDLPPSTDPHLLALYLRTVANGIAVQAASGSSRPELLQVANLALGSWPKL
ncbi:MULTISPECIES: TetR/AcrR family transcriptional regulator [Streptomyces]|uniref:Transcriptional regulator n=1 Tax=Streptomyces sviceus (strain ATCC 29083 / DSM 924 / JCM 4929 / NBRC 13980 / NCIMB 11184 / NRRL 5439 / UC 5370) TaxID=463191 RepID=B5HUU1_STRX2|nr:MULTISPECIES: TetR/AcrR family transcriptional regulator [Streptomyces]EDY56596.1 transcriptional regulator [Streptomyces sviceus ATCC 29083]MYT10739.1 TetR family transcriptional regulator [Streptomyces sp. SID5470]